MLILTGETVANFRYCLSVFLEDRPFHHLQADTFANNCIVEEGLDNAGEEHALQVEVELNNGELASSIGEDEEDMVVVSEEVSVVGLECSRASTETSGGEIDPALPPISDSLHCESTMSLLVFATDQESFARPEKTIVKYPSLLVNYSHNINYG